LHKLIFPGGFTTQFIILYNPLDSLYSSRHIKPL